MCVSGAASTPLWGLPQTGELHNIGDAMLKVLSSHLRNEPMGMLPFNGDTYRRWVLVVGPPARVAPVDSSEPSFVPLD